MIKNYGAQSPIALQLTVLGQDVCVRHCPGLTQLQVQILIAVQSESVQHPPLPGPGVQAPFKEIHEAALTAVGAIMDATIGKETIEANPIFLTTSRLVNPAK